MCIRDSVKALECELNTAKPKADYDDAHSNILDMTQKYGKQLLWIGASFLIGFLILLTDSKFFTAFSFVIHCLAIHTTQNTHIKRGGITT